MGSTKALASADWWSIAQVTLDRRGRHRRARRRLPGLGAARRTTAIERWMLIIAGVALVYPGWRADVVGFGLVLVALALQALRKRAAPSRAA